MKVFEATIAGLIVATVVGVIGWRAEAGDLVLIGAVVFLAAFLLMLMKVRTTSTRRTTVRRRR